MSRRQGCQAAAFLFLTSLLATGNCTVQAHGLGSLNLSGGGGGVHSLISGSGSSGLAHSMSATFPHFWKPTVNPGGRLIQAVSPGGSTITSSVNPGGRMIPAGGSFAQQHPRRYQVLTRDNRLNNQINADQGHLGGNYGSLERQDQAIRQQEQADARFNGGYITRSQQQQLNQEEGQVHQEIQQDYRNPNVNPGGTMMPAPSINPGGTMMPAPSINPGGTMMPAPSINPGGTMISVSTVNPGGPMMPAPSINPGGTMMPAPTVNPGGPMIPAGGSFAQRHPRRYEVLHRDGSLNNQINADRGHLGGNYTSLERQDQAIRQQEQADARFNGGYITRAQQHQLNQEENQVHQEIRQDYNPPTVNPGGPMIPAQ